MGFNGGMQMAPQISLRQPAEHELVMFQLLPPKLVGKVIGKAGCVIKKIKTTTGAHIRIEEPFPQFEERVATLSASSSEGQEDSSAAASVKAAAMMILDNMFDDDGRPEESLLRFLVPEGQVGAIIGKGGSVINQLRKGGAQVKVNKSESATAVDYQILEITGPLEACSSVLEQISLTLLANPPKPPKHHRNQGESWPTRDGVGQPPPYQPDSLMPQPAYFPQQPEPQFGFASFDAPPSAGGLMEFHVACPPDYIGRVIGKGGASIKQIITDTASRLEIADAPEGDPKAERLISISGQEQPNCPYSGVQDALHRIIERTNSNDDRNPGMMFSLKLMTSRSLAGGIIGKGGSIISTIRRESGALITINDNVPLCVPEKIGPAQMIHITGPSQAVVHNAARLVGAHMRKSGPQLSAQYNQSNARSPDKMITRFGL